MKPPDIVELFLEKGELKTVEASYRIALHNLDYLIFIEEGDLDIFFLEPYVKDDSTELFFISAAKKMHTFLADVITGYLTFLFNVSSGNFLFPFLLTSEHFVIAIANSQVRLRVLPLAEVFAYIHKSPFAANFMNGQITGWCHCFTPFLKQFAPPSNPTYLLSEDSKLTFKADETIAPSRLQMGFLMSSGQKNRMPWIRVLTGLLCLNGIKQISLNKDFPPHPLIAAMWLKSLQEGEIEVVIPEVHDLDVDSLWKGLLHFQSNVLELILLTNIKQLGKEALTLYQREEREEELLDETLSTMGDMLSSGSRALVLASDNQLFKACQQIGNQLNLRFLITTDIEAVKNYDDQLNDICFTSRVYSRQVLLTKNWWKQDVGPLLGYIDKENKPEPVALLPVMLGRYEMFKTGTKSQRIAVSDDVEKSLRPEATMFYRSFPEKLCLNGNDILLFCTHNRSKDLFTLVFISLVAAIFMLSFPLAVQLLFDEIIPNFDKTLLATLIAGLSVISLSLLIINVAKEFAILRLTSFISHDLEAAFWGRALCLPIHFFQRFAIGDLIQRLCAVQEIRRKLSLSGIRAVINLFVSFVFFIAMLYYNTVFAIFSSLPLMVGFTIVLFCFWYAQAKERHFQELEGAINGKIVQILASLSKIRIYGAEDRIFAFWAQNTMESTKLKIQINNAALVIKVVNNVVFFFAILAIFYGAIFFLRPSPSHLLSMSIGEFVAFYVVFLAFSTAIIDFSNALIDIPSIYPLWQRSKIILQEPPEGGIDKIKPGKLVGEIRVDTISYRYGNTSPLVLHNVSLYAAPGDFIAIVGSSSSGKSTLLRLLLGLEMPIKGAIYFDGKDLAHLDLEEVRHQMGVTIQNTKIMEGTIRDNIIGGMTKASDHDIMEAIRLAAFERDLEQLPMGLDTLLKSGGTNLSGGQGQRLLIARAFCAKASIMIWDDATNFLDNRMQATVMKNLEQQNITRIVVANNINSVRNANRIYVMEKGSIVGCGTFGELLETNAIFADLVARQQ